jgi:hypothetical protein
MRVKHGVVGNIFYTYLYTSLHGYYADYCKCTVCINEMACPKPAYTLLLPFYSVAAIVDFALRYSDNSVRS